jgi:outer membrane protein assembly factor BamB
MPQPRIIFLGVKGSVIALNRATGCQLWATSLVGADSVNVALDGDNLYATTRGEIFCLDSKTGDARWHNPLKSFGYGLVTIAGEGITPANQNALMAEIVRQQQAAAAASSASAGH